MKQRIALLGMIAALMVGPGGMTFAATIQNIRVMATGIVPVSAEQVLAQVSTSVGDDLNRSTLSEDIKALQQSGYYSYAEVRVEQGLTPDGVSLVYRVTGRPKIRQLTITGADHLGNKKIRTLLDIGSGDLVDDALLGDRSRHVRESYRKEFFPTVKVTWTYTPVPERPELTDLAVTIDEGRRAVVRRILFEGAGGTVPRKEILRNMTQKQSSWMSWYNHDGIYDPMSLLSDRDVIRRTFMDYGFLAVQVGEPTFKYVNKKKIDVTFPIQQGPKYTMGMQRINGVTLFPTQEVTRAITLAPGQLATFSGIDRSSQNIRDYYGSRGYIRTSVQPRILLDTNTTVANIEYRVKEGALAYIRNIDIRGNSKTKDKVVRREIGVAPGDVYNEVRVRSSENRLRNLNYFSYVNSYSEDTSVSNQYSLVFEVEEKPTGQFMLGVGFSSVDDVIGFVELSQGNFDLFGWKKRFTGGGQKLRVRAQLGSERSDLELSFIEPWFLNRRLSFGFDVYRHDAQFLSDEYDQINTGGSVSLGKALTAFDRLNLIYGLEDIDIRDVEETASDRIKEEEGGRLKSYATIEVVRDTRNRTFVPTKGFRGSLSATLAGGPLGADTDTYQFQARASQYFPLWFDHVLNFRGWASIVKEYGDSDRVPIFDRVFLGGPRTVRAFDYREVGPKDEQEEPLGGRSVLYGTVEYTIPIVQSIRFALFYDVGVVYQDIFSKDDDNAAVGDGKVCGGYGLGVRFDFPGFPIQLDYAWPTSADDYNDKSGGRFSFSLGYTY